MMLDVDFVELRQGFLNYLPVGILVGIVFLLELVFVGVSWVISPSAPKVLATPIASNLTNTEALGLVLYTRYVYYFEAAGVVLLVVGILLMFQPNFRRLIFIALIGISVSTQILNADYWVEYWKIQRDMWWQMTWRAPAIRADTLVMAYISGGYNPQQDYEVWGPLNLIYNPNPAKAPAIQAEVLNSETSYSILEKEVRNNHVRDIKLHRDFNNVLLLSIPSSISCLHVIDGRWRIYDVVVQGVSFIASYRTQFDRVIRAESYSSLRERLQKKATETRATETTAAQR